MNKEKLKNQETLKMRNPGALFLFFSPFCAVYALVKGVDKFPVDALRFFIFCLIVSAVSYFFIAIQTFWGSVRNSKLITTVIVFFLLWSFSVLAICTHINYQHDPSPEKALVVKVSDKYTSQGKTLHYRALVESWEKTHSAKTISVHSDVYDKLEPGKSHLKLSLKKGRLGFEWIKNISVHQ